MPLYNPESRTLGQVLATPIPGQSGSYLQVPRFQRKYEWDKEKEVLRLYQDLQDNVGSNYLLGPCVFCSMADESCVEIVDGQQRLVTLVLLIRALVDYMQTRIDGSSFALSLRHDVEELRSDMRRLIVKGRGGDRRPVLRLPRDIQGFFKDAIVLSDEQKYLEMNGVHRGEKPTKRKLRGAYAKLYECLKSDYDHLDGQVLLDELSALADSLQHKLWLISIVVPDFSSAYTVFETINERGRRLGVSDLVKNLFFRKIAAQGDDFLDEVERYWNSGESMVSNFSSFIWHAWISRQGSCPKSRVFGRIEEHVGGLSEGAAFDLLTDLMLEDVASYKRYEQPDTILSSERVLKLKREQYGMLRAMGASRCYPLLLSIDFAERKSAIGVDDALNLLRIITALTFWHSAICEKDAKTLEAVYHDKAYALRRAVVDERATLEAGLVKEALCARFPSLRECEAAFSLKTYSEAAVPKMILRALEKELRGDAVELSLDDSDIWLEHVLPQNPGESSVWMETFASSQDRNAYTWSLGNLTLIAGPYNRGLSNSTFDVKRAKYAESDVRLTRELSEVAEWNGGTIEARTARLFQLARAAWPLPS